MDKPKKAKKKTKKNKKNPVVISRILFVHTGIKMLKVEIK